MPSHPPSGPSINPDSSRHNGHPYGAAFRLNTAAYGTAYSMGPESLVTKLAHQGLNPVPHGEGSWRLTCPWAAEHTGHERSAAQYTEPREDNRYRGDFTCGCITRSVHPGRPGQVRDISSLYHWLNERYGNINAQAGAASKMNGNHAASKMNGSHANGHDTHQRTGFLTSAHDVKMQNIDWVWKHRLARGMLHLIADHGGTAKSTIAFTLAAAISSGGTFPDGTKAPIGKVAIWSGEDNYATTIKPRMHAAGANFDNVLFLTGARTTMNGESVEFNPAEHMPALREELEHHPDVALVIIDPIVSAIKGDSHKNAEVRKDLQPLVDLLEATGAVGIGITHYTKATAGRHIVERVTGSLAFAAIARMIFATVQEKDDASRYRIVVGKTNIAPLGGGYEYSVETTDMLVEGTTIEATKIVWGDALEGEPLKLIADAEGPATGRPPEKRSDAIDLLLDLLKHGPVRVADIRKAGEANGISFDTLKRARKAINIHATKIDPKNPRSEWQWATTAQAMADVLKAAPNTKTTPESGSRTPPPPSGSDHTP